MTNEQRIEAERKHAHQVMNDLDEDLELARKLQDEEHAEVEKHSQALSEDERLARELQEQYDKEHEEHEEYLRKSGVDTSTLRRPTRANLDTTSLRRPTAAVIPPMQESTPEVDLLAFGENPPPPPSSNVLNESAFSDVDFGSTKTGTPPPGECEQIAMQGAEIPRLGLLAGVL